MLGRGQKMLAADLFEDAGRAAYLAAFHAAEALIFERDGRAQKPHRGVQSEFSRLKEVPSVPVELRGSLFRAYGPRQSPTKICKPAYHRRRKKCVQCSKPPRGSSAK